MNLNDFRCFHQAKPIRDLMDHDATILTAINLQDGQCQKALLLLHGFSSTPGVFRYLIPSLTTTYNAIFCPILPGHASNLQTFAATKANTWLQFTEHFYQKIQQEFAAIDVMGLSLGGLLACNLSQKFSLRHLYLLAPALDLNFSLDKMISLAKTLRWLKFKEIRSAPGDIQGTAHAEIAFRKLPIASIIEILTLIKTFYFTLPSCPTDLFLGRHDKVIAPTCVAARFAKSKHTNIHWLENSGHVLPLDNDLETIISVVQTINKMTI